MNRSLIRRWIVRWRLPRLVALAALALASLGTAASAGASAASGYAASSGHATSLTARPAHVTGEAVGHLRASVARGRSAPAHASVRVAERHAAAAMSTSALSALRLRAAISEQAARRAPAYRPDVRLAVTRLRAGNPRALGAAPAVTCPDVWEGPPYLNRYDHYVDNGSGVCVLGTGYDVEPTTISGTLTLPSLSYLEDTLIVPSGAQLIVPAGATIQASSPPCCGSATAIYVAGALSMPGTSASPISLTTPPNVNAPGTWGGVAFWPGGSGALSYVHLSYAGATMSCDGSNCTVNAGLYINNGSQTTVSVDHTTIDYGSGNGLEIANTSAPTLSALTLNNNAGWAVQYDALLPTGTVDDPNVVTGSGNGHDGVHVIAPNNCITCSGGTLTGTLSFVHAPLDNVEIDGTFAITTGAQLNLGAGLGLVQLIAGCSGGIGVQPGGAMSVGAGDVVQFGPACYGASTGIYNQGTLTMNGTASQPISLTSTSATPAPGAWQGVGFWPGSSGSLSYVHLSYAGGSASCGGNGCSGEAALSINGASVSVDHTTIDYSFGRGLEIAGNAAPTLNAVTLNNNANWAVQYDFLPTSGTLDDPAAVSGSGNVDNGVLITSGGTVTGNLSVVTGSLDTVQFDGPVTVNVGARFSVAAGVPLVQFSGASCGPSAVVTVNPGAQMTVGAGANLEFAGNCGGNAALDVGGTLSAIGASGQPITMTGTTNVLGAWGGVAFLPGGSGTLSYVHLSYGGAGNTCGGNGCSGSAGLSINGASVSVDHTTIDYSSGRGLEIAGGATPSLFAITLNGNADWAVQYDFLPASGTLNNPTAVSGSGNGHNGVRVTSGGAITGAFSVVNGSLNSVEIDGPVTVNAGGQLALAAGLPLVQFAGLGCAPNANVTVNNGAQMTVGAGDTLEFNNNCGGSAALYIAGTLTMNGTAGQPIALTSPNPGAGAWGGVAFWPGGNGTLSYVHLSYAGGGSQSSPTGPSVNAALEIDDANPSISFTTIDNSGGNDVEVSGGGLPVLHNDAFGTVPAGKFGVVNDNGASGPSVNATQNWWNDPSGPSGPGGSGSGVPVSLGVTFAPWLGASPTAPQLASSRASGGYRDTVTVTGTNFGPSEPVMLYWDSSATTPISHTATNGNGAFIVTFTVPQGVAGAHSIIAVGTNSFKSASLAFTITPKSFLLHSSGTQGLFNALAGYGFGPYETVVARWSTPKGILLGTATTDALGTFAGPLSLTFTTPVSATGVYAVYAFGVSSGAASVNAFTLVPSLSIAPAVGTAGSHATIAGTGYGANETVTVKFDCSSASCASTQVLGSATTNASGNFSGLAVTIPTTATNGLHVVGGKGTKSGAFASTYYYVIP